MNQRNQTVKEPGLMCPVCGKFIPTSVAELLSCRGLDCPSCGLHLEIDREQSQKALEALQQLDRAHKRVNSTSQFNR